MCIFPDLQPVEKLLFKALFVPYVLMILGFVFVIHRVIQMICRGCRPQDHNLTVSHNNNVGNTKTASFSCRLASGFTLAMLFTYQKMATTTFALLNCVPVGNFDSAAHGRVQRVLRVVAVWCYAICRDLCRPILSYTYAWSTTPQGIE